MFERGLILKDIHTYGQRTAKGILQKVGLVQRDVFKILEIPSLEIPVPREGQEYLLVGPSGGGKSIFLRSLGALLQSGKQFDVPGNTPCFVEGSVIWEGELRLDLGDEYGSQISVNQFNKRFGTYGPLASIQIAHDPVSIRAHRNSNRPIIFIDRGRVVFIGTIDEAINSSIDVLKKYMGILQRNGEL